MLVCMSMLIQMSVFIILPARPLFYLSFMSPSISLDIPPFHNMFAPCLLILSIIVYFYANNSCYKIFIIPPLTMLLYALLFSYNLPGDFSPPGDAVAAFSAMGDLVGAICFHRTAMTCAVGSTECGGVVGASSSAQFLCRSPNGSWYHGNIHCIRTK